MARSPVEEIKERLSILDVIGAYVELKHAGKSYKGKSPFTNEKTPSFYVSPDRGMYYCFSSNQGGDMFTFIEKMEGVDFKGALKILAEKANVELVPEDPKKRDARETQYALLEEAAKYFFKELEGNKTVQEYIKKRGVSTQTLHTWRIGYARDEWRALKDYLKSKKFTEEEMLKAGLIKNADQGKAPYDVFRDRIMFPIFDSSGRVVAFSGRTMKSESGIPKYVNSPETELFVKSEILYGYDKAKNGIRHFDFSLVVEGQFDLVLSHQAGYTNTVAVSGTALTKHHIMLLLRLSKNVVLALDADRAGISAVKRSALPMLLHGMDVKVASMPEGQDPADMVKNDSQAFKKVIGGAKHVVEFLLQVLKANTKDERTYKLRVREEVIPLLVAIDNRIDREHFEGVIAEHIGATKEGIHFEVERIGDAGRKKMMDEHVPVAVPKVEEKVAANRKRSIENYIRALLSVLTGERKWIADVMQKTLKDSLTKEEMAVFTKEEGVGQGEVFTLEEQIEHVKERELLGDLGHTLTEYLHIIAKERLARLRPLLDQSDISESIEKEMREAQKLHQIHVVISKN